jgi:hypothetical protein
MSIPPTVITSEDQFKSGYAATILLIPVVTVNPLMDKTPIQLEVSGNKSFPGIEDGEEWEFKTDNPEQEIAEKIVGKSGGISPLSYEIPYDPMLQKILVAHAKTQFTVRILYDDTSLPKIYKIDVLKCFLKSPGTTSPFANNSAPNMTITLQPRGGGKLADTLDISATPRT